MGGVHTVTCAVAAALLAGGALTACGGSTNATGHECPKVTGGRTAAIVCPEDAPEGTSGSTFACLEQAAKAATRAMENTAGGAQRAAGQVLADGDEPVAVIWAFNGDGSTYRTVSRHCNTGVDHDYGVTTTTKAVEVLAEQSGATCEAVANANEKPRLLLLDQHLFVLGDFPPATMCPVELVFTPGEPSLRVAPPVPVDPWLTQCLGYVAEPGPLVVTLPNSVQDTRAGAFSIIQVDYPAGVVHCRVDDLGTTEAAATLLR